MEVYLVNLHFFVGDGERGPRMENYIFAPNYNIIKGIAFSKGGKRNSETKTIHYEQYY